MEGEVDIRLEPDGNLLVDNIFQGEIDVRIELINSVNLLGEVDIRIESSGDVSSNVELIGSFLLISIEPDGIMFLDLLPLDVLECPNNVGNTIPLAPMTEICE